MPLSSLLHPIDPVLTFRLSPLCRPLSRLQRSPTANQLKNTSRVALIVAFLNAISTVFSFLAGNLVYVGLAFPFSSSTVSTSL